MGRGEATPCLSEPSRWGQAHTAAAAETHGQREGVPYSQHFQVKGPAPPLSSPEGAGRPRLPRPPSLPSDPPKELKVPFPSSACFFDCPTVLELRQESALSPNPGTVSLNFFVEILQSWCSMGRIVCPQIHLLEPWPPPSPL